MTRYQQLMLMRKDSTYIRLARLRVNFLGYLDHVRYEHALKNKYVRLILSTPRQNPLSR